jgi:phage repressor protein C with HTH and peptisase S24 domain
MFPVKGDSMIPTFYPGDILICEYVENLSYLKDNECYVVVSTEGICVKRCINAVKKRKAIIIESDNQEYKPDLIPIEAVLEIWRYKARITHN